MNFCMDCKQIRTPLNCIVGLSNLLLDSSNLDKEVQESLEMITSSGDLLLAVVDDVLDYAKLTTGKVETKIEATNVQRTINSVISSVRPKASSNGLELRTHLDLPESMETDGRRLQQILFNLLGNAIKFGANRGFIDFSARKQSTADGKEYVQFAIKDYGNGIAPSEMGTIFEPFHQATTNAECHGGTGLGLAITRQLVRVLGGNIDVRSDYGKWCEFTFYLPSKNQDGLTLEESLCEELEQLKKSIYESDSEDEDYDEYDTTGRPSCASFDDMSSCTESTIDVQINEARKTLLQVSIESKLGERTSVPSTVQVDKLSPATASIASKPFSKESIAPANLKKPTDSAANNVASSAASSVVPSNGEVTGSVGSLRVLIAEDNLVNQKVLHRTLKRIGLEQIDIVDNGEKAVNAAADTKYDVIFMDLQMPILDGLEATSIISKRRQELEQRFPKIVFLSAHALQDYKEKAANVGGDGFISKPFKPDAIKKLLNEVHTDICGSCKNLASEVS